MKSLQQGLMAATFFSWLVTMTSLIAAVVTRAEIMWSYAATSVVVMLVFALAEMSVRVAARYRR